jgi:hypothetical protein
VSYGPNPSARYITTYFRRSFVLTNAGAVTNLLLRVLYDDGAVVYLNGTEAVWANMPAGVITFSTLATTATENALFSSTISPGLLANGTNVVAVEVHQNLPSSTDLSFDLELIGSTDIPPSTNTAVRAVLNEVLVHNQSVSNGDGTITDWVDLHNPGGQPVDVADCSLSDSPSNPRRWIFPASNVLSPHGFLVVRCDAAAPPSTNSGGVLNTGFNLRRF